MQNAQTDIAQTRRSGKILLWVPLVALLGLSAWFLWWSYASKVEQAEHAEIGKLQAMVRTLAHNIDGEQHAHLMKAFTTEDAITHNDQNLIYEAIQKTLRLAKDDNELPSDVYTVVLQNSHPGNTDEASGAFCFGVTSADKPYFRHAYAHPPPVLVEQFRVGAMIPQYHDENGTWLSAFAPFTDKEGNVVGVVMADLPFDHFISDVRSELLANALLLGLLFSLIAILLYTITHRVTTEMVTVQESLNSGYANLDQTYRAISDFAQQIGHGNLEADLNNLDQNDTLVKAMLTMRNNLQSAHQLEDERSWISEGLARTHQLIRGHRSAHALGDAMLPYLTERIGAVQGAFYSVQFEESDDVETIRKTAEIELAASFAYNRKKYLGGRFKMGEGLVGQSALEGKSIHRTEIPDSYTTITSGILGDQKPGALIIVPLITNQKVFGLLEFAGFTRFSERQLQLLETLSETIARILFNLKAVQNEQMKGQMQALSENSPDLITRFNKDGKFYYINPTIEEYTGRTPEYYLKKQLDEVGLDHGVEAAWQEIIQQVTQQNNKAEAELVFPSQHGDRQLRVNAIPEYNNGSNDQPDSVLVVSHDITKMKAIEAEIRDKNKKIGDSINYAKRLQNVILPNNRFIREVFPESFIFYEPKDVVSGDFPWFYEKEDEVLIAAVDCTGHGVPGAMLSLIGYFLLNEINSHRETLNAAEILDRLHQNVRSTLKQDREGADARDGMDIALVKVHRKTGEVQFAGAHRPLYHVRKGELTQIKGDRKAIGGIELKRKAEKPFTNHVVDIEPGDAIYFFSDGLPDQEGGPETRKYGPKRIRETAAALDDKDMTEISTHFENDFLSWKGDLKQLDDVLMIGIRF